MKKLLGAFVLLGTLWSSGATAQTNCMVPSAFPATPVVSSATEGSRVLKAAPGCLLAAYATTGAVAGYMMIFNSVSVPADGAVTPINCIYIPANTTIAANWAPQPPEFYSTGMSMAFSSTGCFTKTVSATAFFHALVQ